MPTEPHAPDSTDTADTAGADDSTSSSEVRERPRLTLEDAVRRVLGDGGELREAQRDALSELTERDTLLVARSGAGKTAVYAIATLTAGRLTLVVSPLLALQRDQVDALEESGLRARTVSSALTATQQREALAAAAAGELDVLLLAPEQLARREVVETLAGTDVGLLVVDEAHCVSEWGHDFRPDYLHLAGAAEQIGSPRVLALTATASDHVRREIVERLGMAAQGKPEPRVLVHDADRPNIWLGARTSAGQDEQDAAVVEAAVGTDGAGIVYARTRAQVEHLAEAIADAGRPALVYHAGLGDREREETQDRFLSGDADLVVATSAFGMGVDRPDVRFVLHAGPPPSLDAYYQEAGRAGRDGADAIAMLFHRPDDFGLNHYLRSGGTPRATSLRAVADAVRQGASTRSEIAEAADMSTRTVARVLGVLLQIGAVRQESGVWHVAEDGPDDVADAARQEHEHRQALDRSRVEMVRTYADTTDCRRRLLLELLGEEHPERCGRCDSCDAGTSVEVEDAALHPGQHVEHSQWGAGTVSVVETDRATVLFEERGYATLDLAVALDSGVLQVDDAAAGAGAPQEEPAAG